MLNDDLLFDVYGDLNGVVSSYLTETTQPNNNVCDGNNQNQTTDESSTSLIRTEDRVRREYAIYLNDIKTSFDHKFELIRYDKERPVFLSILNKLRISKSNSQWYGLTLTFKRKFHSSSPRWLHKYAHEKLTRMFCKKYNCEWYAFPEFTQAGILHYHCIVYNIYEVNMVKMMNSWKRQFGFVKWEKDVRYKDIWIKYCIKDRNRHGLYTIRHDQKMLSTIPKRGFKIIPKFKTILDHFYHL